MTTCADCKHWRATSRWFPDDDVQPHERRAFNAATELALATEALCCAPAPSGNMPTWLRRLADAGMLTHETDGADCLAFEQREAIWPA